VGFADFRREGVCFIGAAGIVDQYIISVTGQAFGDSRANAPSGACYYSVSIIHVKYSFIFPLLC
jgi:hypothetical protein